MDSVDILLDGVDSSALVPAVAWTNLALESADLATGLVVDAHQDELPGWLDRLI